MSLMAHQLLELVALFLLPFFLLLLCNKLLISKRTHLPPSPPKLPILGNLHQLGSLPHVSLHALSKKHGPLMFLRLGQMPTLVVSSAELAKEILKTHDTIFAGRPSQKAAKILFRGWDIGFTPYGNYWRQLRKLSTTHLLSSNKVQSFNPIREEEVANMIGEISRASGPVNMSEILQFFGNDIICRVVSGKFFKDVKKKKMLCQMIEENSVLLGAFHMEDYFPSSAWLDRLFGLSRRSQRNSDRWDRVLDEIIEAYSTDKMTDDVGQDGDFVHALLSLQRDPTLELALTKQQIKALLMDIFAAGTDTSYVVLEWAMVELIRNPETMTNLQAEVRELANGKSMVREEDLNEMNYLKAVLKEVLRLHPPAPLLLPHESMEDCQINGYQIPTGTRVLVNAWAIARDPKFWDAPEEFRPERFMNRTLDYKGNDFHFIPFGAGRRICPGMNFASCTVELALANLVHQFDWGLQDGMKPEELDMAEAPGLAIRRAASLVLVPKSSG